MFLVGRTRSISNDQPLDKTFVALNSNYANDSKLIEADVPMLKAWAVKYSDNKANPNQVEQ